MTKDSEEQAAAQVTHCPGPWTIRDGSGWGATTIYGNDPRLGSKPTRIATVLNHDNGAENARLIAAAPTLLKALKLALMEFDRISYQKRADSDVLSVLNKAVAKAEGVRS